MIITIIFFIAAYLFGRGILAVTQVETGNLVGLISVVLGVLTLSLLLFFLGWILPFTPLTIWTTIVLIVIWSLICLWQQKTNLFQENLDLVKTYLKLSRAFKIWGLLLILLVIWFFSRALFFDQQGSIVAGDRLVWTDWPVHTGLAANFAWGQNFPPQNPFFSGIPLVYPFMADFVSGALLALGVAYHQAFTIPGIILTLAFFGVFIYFCQDLLTEAKSVKLHIGIGALCLSLFWGGWGFIYWLQEILVDEALLVERLLSPPREYTFWSEKGLWFFTFLYSEILPQRAFLFGLPMFFLILWLVKTGWEKMASADKPGRKYLVLAGILAGILPFFHTHTFLSIVFLSITMFVLAGSATLLWQSRKEVLVFFKAAWCYFLPMVLLTLIQLPVLQTQFKGLPFAWGWMKQSENFFWFWFKNTGLFIPIYFLGLWKGRFTWWTKLVGVSAWSLFIIPNLFQFAPWGYDNLKIFTYWYLLGSVFVMTGLVWIWGKKPSGPVIASSLILSLTLSGVIEVARLIPTSVRQVRLWTSQDIMLANQIKQITPPDAVFLTAAVHDHPVTALAGRKITIGFPGNMWSWGVAGWNEREQDVHQMFQGGETAKSLWKKYRIDYIIVSDREKWFEPELDEEFIAQNSTLILEKDSTKIYQIN